MDGLRSLTIFLLSFGELRVLYDHQLAFMAYCQRYIFTFMVSNVIRIKFKGYFKHQCHFSSYTMFKYGTQIRIIIVPGFQFFKIMFSWFYPCWELNKIFLFIRELSTRRIENSACLNDLLLRF